MKYITKHQFDSLVCENGIELDVVAKCTTKWHLLGIRAFLEKLSESYDNIRMMILIQKHDVAGYLIREEDLIFPQNTTCEVYYEEPSVLTGKQRIKKLIPLLFESYKIQDNKKLYILYPFHPDYALALMYSQKTQRLSVPVCIDEGIGTYRGFWDLFVFNFNDSKKKALFFVLFELLRKLLSLRIHSTDFTLFKKEGAVLIKQKEVVDYYRTILLQDSKGKEIIVPQKDYILVITQPFEQGESQKFIKHVEKIYGRYIEYFREKGFKIIYKPHPRESEERYQYYSDSGDETIIERMAMETLIAAVSNKPRYVLGNNSTALVTANVLYEIQAISIIKSIYQEMPAKSKKGAREFIKMYQSYIEFDELPK